jgi:hypothetical protein
MDISAVTTRSARTSTAPAYAAIVIGAVLTVLLPPPNADAQSIATGTRVRIASGDSLTVGHVFQSTADSLVIGRDLGGRLAFSWNDIDRAEYSAGMKSNAGRGALMGAGLMSFLAISAIILDGVDDDSDDSSWGSAGDWDYGPAIAIIVLPMFVALGAGAGALIGLMVRTERWNVVPISTSAIGQNGLGVSLAIRW